MSKDDKGGVAKKAVLFACTQNSIRSPMAEALMRKRWGGQMIVASCGVYGGGDDPFAVEAMREVGLDIAERVSRLFEDLPRDLLFDVVVALTPEAHHRALEWVADKGWDAETMFWLTNDPTAVIGGREQVMESYRGVRDALDARIRARFGAGGKP